MWEKEKMQQLQQLFEMSPTLQAVVIGTLIGLVLLGAFVVLVKPAPAMNYEMINGKMEPVFVFESDNADELGIGAQSYAEAKVISFESARLRNLYPARDKITGDVARNVQNALNPEASFTFRRPDGDDAA